MMDKRPLNLRARLWNVPTRTAALLLLFGLSMPMQTANSQVTATAQGVGVPAAPPSDKQTLAVAVSLDIAKSFKVDSVSLLIDDKVVYAQSYGSRDIAAFYRGTVLAQFQGDMPSGEHHITVFYTGIDGQNRAFKRENSFVVTKAAGPKYVQLRISDAHDADQPTFLMDEW
jgi:hypothetical protein